MGSSFALLLLQPTCTGGIGGIVRLGVQQALQQQGGDSLRQIRPP